MKRILTTLAQKWPEYLIEAIVIVASILGAISLENWNEDRKENKLLREYYNQLQVDLKQQLVLLDTAEAEINQSIGSYEAYKALFKTPDLDPSEVSEALSKTNYTVYTVTLGSSTIESLQNTGDIRMIPMALRNKLILLNSEYSRVTSIYDHNATMYAEMLSEALMLGTIVNDSRYSNQAVLREFINAESRLPEILSIMDVALSVKNFNETQMLSYIQELGGQVNEILELIEKELK
jgi:hypothetical protein